MIGISVANKDEWIATLAYFKKDINDCIKYPYGEYFIINKYDKELIFYRCGVRKTNSVASNQYMIDHFNLEKVIVAGTCAGIDDKYKPLDILVPSKAVQYDCTVKEMEPLIKESLSADIKYCNCDKDCVIGTADKPVVMWKDYLDLKNNNITIADTEASAIAYVCQKNNVDCIIVKGISDFPVKEIETDAENALKVQYDTFVQNIPLIMNAIYDTKLEELVK